MEANVAFYSNLDPCTLNLRESWMKHQVTKEGSCLSIWCSVPPSRAPKVSKSARCCHCGRLAHPPSTFQSTSRPCKGWQYGQMLTGQSVTHMSNFCVSGVVLWLNMSCMKMSFFQQLSFYWCLCLFFYIKLRGQKEIGNAQLLHHINDVTQTEAKEFHLTKSLPRQNPNHSCLVSKCTVCLLKHGVATQHCFP